MRRLSLLAAVVLAGCGDDDPCASPPVGYVCPVAGTGELGFNRDGLAPASTDFYLLSAARRGPDGRVYLMDFNNQRIRVIDTDGLVRTVAGTGFHAIAADGGPAIDSPLENPIDFDFLPDGRLVFVSYHDPRVLAIGADGILQRVAGHGEVGLRGNEGDFESALSALFIQLDGIAVAPDGAIYVSDSLAHRVRVIRDGIITPAAGNGEEAYAGDGGPAIAAALHGPTALALDPSGNLLIADTQNHVVRKLALDGTITTIAGVGTRGYGGDGGPATAAELDQPYGLAVDTDGAIYVADRGNFRVRRIDAAGVIDTIAGVGLEGHAGDGGPALAAKLGYVARLSVDGDSLLVADQSNGAARRIRLR